MATWTSRTTTSTKNTAHEVFPSDLAPHAFRQGNHLWPQRMPGLSVLLAIPFGLGGAVGARAALPLVIIPLLAVAVYRWSRTCLGPLDATVASVRRAGLQSCCLRGVADLPGPPGGSRRSGAAGLALGKRTTHLPGMVRLLVRSRLVLLDARQVLRGDHRAGGTRRLATPARRRPPFHDCEPIDLRRSSAGGSGPVLGVLGPGIREHHGRKGQRGIEPRLPPSAGASSWDCTSIRFTACSSSNRSCCRVSSRWDG